MSDIIYAYIDGASSGNPGPAGAGVLISDKTAGERKLLFFLGETTNNVAEYMAFILCLEELKGFANKLIVYSDSELLVKQINGEYKIRNSILLNLYNKVKQLLGYFDSVKIKHIDRENNKEADSLAKRAIKLARLVG